MFLIVCWVFVVLFVLFVLVLLAMSFEPKDAREFIASLICVCIVVGGVLSIWVLMAYYS